MSSWSGRIVCSPCMAMLPNSPAICARGGWKRGPWSVRTSWSSPDSWLVPLRESTRRRRRASRIRTSGNFARSVRRWRLPREGWPRPPFWPLICVPWMMRICNVQRLGSPASLLPRRMDAVRKAVGRSYAGPWAQPPDGARTRCVPFRGGAMTQDWPRGKSWRVGRVPWLSALRRCRLCSTDWPGPVVRWADRHCSANSLPPAKRWKHLMWCASSPVTCASG